MPEVRLNILTTEQLHTTDKEEALKDNNQFDVAAKIQRELELEEESVQIGIKKYRDMTMTSDLMELPPGVRLMQNAMEPLIKAIRAFKESRMNSGRFFSTRVFLMDLSDEEIAYIIAHRCINAVGEVRPIQSIAISVATMLKDQLDYQKFKAEQPAYLHAVERNLKTSHTRHRRIVIVRARKKMNIETAEWTEADLLHVGMKCIEMFIESTGLIEKEHTPGGMIHLKPTEQVIEWIEVQHAKCELLNPLYMPMIVKPLPWTAPYGGGYLSNQATMSHKLVKTRDTQALRQLEKVEMPMVYKALNAVQETPWRINRRVFEVMKTVWDTGDNLGGLPSRHDEPLPATPWCNNDEFEWTRAEQPDVVKQWKVAATKVYDRRVRVRSKRFTMIQKLWMAEKFLDEPEMYFCWTLDWRGRMYPIQSFINPQADDSGKALIEFAEGKQLGERGAWWLRVHLANVYGYDKVSFEDRVKWVDEHEAEILDSANDPLDGGRFWTSGDSPYQFLAGCFDYAGYKKTGNAFVSHLAVALDGTCNGLQNFSAMLRDEVGGKAVNLVPSEKPSDIYSEVAAVVSRMVEEDVAEGNEMAKLWLGKIDRGIAKRNVMTVPYGAKKYGMKNQLMEELAKRDTATARYLENEGDNFGPANYLADVMYDGIGQVVIAARAAMDWLQAVAKIAAQSEKALWWSTPVGFRPQQRYMKRKLVQIATIWGGVRMRLGLMQDLDKLDRMKQANGISPNYVHSLDASHLMLTINKCLDEGLTSFSMIHDSYGTHAADTDKLAYLLREAFIEQYREDVLEKFREEVMRQLPDELARGIPPVPPKGNLDLEAVRQSHYFFA